MKANWGEIWQVAYLVDDLDASVERWRRFTRVGPWTIYRNAVMEGHYRGAPTRVTIDVALGYQGSVQIELIKLRSRTPSPYQHADGTPIIGMHHVAWISDDLDADIAKAKESGLSLAFQAGNGAVNVAYFEAPAEPGILFEFIHPLVPGMRDGWKREVEDARQWDGSGEAVRIIDFTKGV